MLRFKDPEMKAKDLQPGMVITYRGDPVVVNAVETGHCDQDNMEITTIEGRVKFTSVRLTIKELPDMRMEIRRDPY
jgi:hypothetical protein